MPKQPNMKDFWNWFEKSMNNIFFWIIAIAVCSWPFIIIFELLTKGGISEPCCSTTW